MQDVTSSIAAGTHTKVCPVCQSRFCRRQKEYNSRLSYCEGVQAFAARTYCSRRCAKTAFVHRKLPRGVSSIPMTQEELEDIKAQHAQLSKA